jgi:alpha-galactosidase
MKLNKIIIFLYLVIFSVGAFHCQSQQKKQSDAKENMVAPKPPMGWNSFDAYDCAITEDQFKATVDYMAEHLLEYGWEYAVIDYIWFNPAPGSWNNPNRRFGHPDLRINSDGTPQDTLAMDQWGRLLPAVNRFPSAKNGNGFKLLADYAHSKGLKFGIHIMRGIPRQAYYENRPILGTNYTAAEITEPWDVCNWNNNMFGIDTTKSGAQEYYNSIFNLYADWGVDYIKADDMMYPTYHKGEIEMMRRAIDQCGRPIVLSLSPGEAPLSQAKHLEKHANMWRISRDFWDEWDKLLHTFDLLNAWSSYIEPNHWPDADMLPIGHISLGGRPHGPDRISRLTLDEHYTLMTLWCIARSPLIMGGDLLTSPERSLSFLKNKEVIAVNQHSENNRQVYRDFQNTMTFWMADIPGSEDKYLALFNLGDEKKIVIFNFELEYMRDKYLFRDLWAHKDLGVFEKEFGVELAEHGAGLYRLKKQ